MLQRKQSHIKERLKIDSTHYALWQTVKFPYLQESKSSSSLHLTFIGKGWFWYPHQEHFPRLWLHCLRHWRQKLVIRCNWLLTTMERIDVIPIWTKTGQRMCTSSSVASDLESRKTGVDDFDASATASRTNVGTAHTRMASLTPVCGIPVGYQYMQYSNLIIIKTYAHTNIAHAQWISANSSSCWSNCTQDFQKKIVWASSKEIEFSPDKPLVCGAWRRDWRRYEIKRNKISGRTFLQLKYEDLK